MAEQQKDRLAALGAFDAEGTRKLTAVEIIAAALSVLWLIIVAIAFLGFGIDTPDLGTDPFGFVMALVAIFMPIALIWVAAAVARTARVMREETVRLQSAVTAMRYAYLEQSQGDGGPTRKPSVEKTLDTLVRQQKETADAIVQFTTRRDPTMDRRPALPKPDPAPVQASADGQPVLALGTPSEALREPISVSDFIKAANFPETAEDKDGFRALRLALEDREAAKLIRAAQDVLTLLSQDGIYMDDLRPDRTRPDLWRKFASGDRSGAISGLGAIRDRSCLALTSARMRSDPVFRDTAHHFLRQFDRTLERFEPEADDGELARFSETRSARAFMLLGRVTGMFD